MKYVAAAKFKEQCLAILDRVDPAGIVITKHGKPVARLTPIRSSSAHFVGCMKGKIRVRGPILTTGVRWDAQS
jgi:prevent-host-death family protein